MTVRYFVAALGIILLSTVSLPAFATTLHVIVVGDTEDPNIGVGVETDTKKFSREMERVAEATGLTLSDIVVKGSNFTVQNLVRTIRGIRVNPDDVIVFLYSGHGQGEPGKETMWPYMMVPDPESGKYAHADFADVVDLLGEQKPRLLVALADACNNFGSDAKGARNSRDQGIPIRPLTMDVKAGYQRLFLEGRGILIAAAASPSEVANGEVSGGVLTNGFLMALVDEVEHSSPSWESVAVAATVPISRTSPSGRTERQTPIYRIDMAKTSSQDAFSGFSSNTSRSDTGGIVSDSVLTPAPDRSSSPPPLRSDDDTMNLFK